MKRRNLTQLAFSTTILFSLIIYICLGIAPFGTNTLMVWDMEWQYSSFLTWFHNVLIGNADWKYSLIGGFGGNTMGLISYYLSSPLNLILIFFNIQTMPWGIMLLTLLKSGFMASAMQFYLYKKREDFFSVLFACMYALSSYAICYQSNIMWMDSLILLPLIIYGLEQLIDNSNGFLYTVTLGLAIICNYYMGYILCLFSMIYFVAYLFINKQKEHNRSSFFNKILKFSIYSLLAGGLSAFLILPTIYNLKLSSNKHMMDIAALLDMTDIFEYKECLQYFMAGSFNSNQGIVGNYPLIYCGIFPLFLVILFFLVPKNTMKSKIFYGILLFILLLSFNKKGLYLIWHGCYEPVGSPWRFSFLWTFLFLTIGYLGLSALKKENYIFIIPAFIITTLYFAYMVLRNKNLLLPLVNLFIVAALILLYLYCQTIQKKRNIILCSTLALLICGSELSYNALKLHSIQFPLTTHKRYENIKYYLKQTDTTQTLLEYIDTIEDTNTLYRTELLNEAARSSNDGYLYNINTLNMYSSSEKQLTWDIFANLGWSMPTMSAKYDNNCTYLSRSLSGVKYIIDSELQSDDTIYKKLAETNGYTLYQNVSALPLGFVVNDSALDITNISTKNFFEHQNALYHALIGSSSENPYLPLSDALKESNAIAGRIIKQADGIYTDAQKIYTENIALLEKTIELCQQNTLSLESNKDSKINGSFFNPTVSTAYVCFTIPYEDSWKIKVDGKICNSVSGMGGFLLVPISPGEHTIELNYQIPYFRIGIFVSLGCLIFILKNKQLLKTFPKKSEQNC